ncbi:replication protein C [bacterium]|nr:replication protein C [bacterium]
MNQPQTTTLSGAAEVACARPAGTGTGFAGIGRIDQQPPFAPVTRRALMAAVNTAGRALGLRPATVSVLDALLSCLPCQDARTGQDRPITPLTLLTVYACNATLCFRARGITDRQLRRHLDKLEALSLIRRRDSANGKRFPILQKGKVVGAFGLDLSPLLARSGAILALAQKTRDEACELRGLKAEILKLRQACLPRALPEAARALVDGAATLIRRTSLTLTEARGLIAQLTALLDPAPDTTEMPATDGQNVRHKETPKSEISKPASRRLADLWDKLTTIPAFYPEAPRTDHRLLQLIFEFGTMLRIRTALLAKAVTVLGMARTLQIADQIASAPDRVQNPDGYLARIIASGQTAVGHGQLALTT